MEHDDTIVCRGSRLPRRLWVQLEYDEQGGPGGHSKAEEPSESRGPSTLLR